MNRDPVRRRAKMEAREYLDLLKDDKGILCLAQYSGDACDGRGHAVIINEEHRIAVMLEDCGFPDQTGVRAGYLVKFVLHPEGEPKILGTPATIRP
jgi:hypothetical protein